MLDLVLYSAYTDCTVFPNYILKYSVITNLIISSFVPDHWSLYYILCFVPDHWSLYYILCGADNDWQEEY